MTGSGGPRRVVVTGMGVVTPIGMTVPDFWAGCRRAQVGVGELSGFPLEDLK
ncbi:MAG: beta-ACP synthase, partial [Planctomycetaceae bacterium]